MKYLIFAGILVFVVGYLLYEKFRNSFKGIVVSYSVFGNALLNGNKQLVLNIKIFNPNAITLKVNNPQISIFDGNSNLLVRLDLQQDNKTVFLTQGNNEYNFKIKDKFQFTNGLNLSGIKTYFSANLYGIEFSKEIPTSIN